MKQSKKLLSIFLAMIMLLGTVSVIGNAGYQKAQMAYDSVDNPAPTADQVANLVLDVLDEMLYDMGFNENYVVIKLDLTSVDAALDTLASFDGIKWLAGGDIANLDLDAIDGVTRSGNGDMGVLYAVLEFLYDNADTLSKAAYGIGTSNGIDLGWLIDLIGLDLGDIGTILENIPGYLVKMVYDMIIYGSYGYDLDSEELAAAGRALPAEADSLDEIIQTAVNGFLTKPQEYEWVPTGQVDAEGNSIDTKVWDESSYILDASKIAGKDLSLTNNSVFSLLDSLLQIAWEDFGTVVLNHDVKKIFMEGMDVDFVELDPKLDAEEIAKIKADADYVDVEKAGVDVSSVKNFLCNSQMWEVDGTWYFRDYVTRNVLDANGNIQYEKDKDGKDVVDEEGNKVPITQKVNRYQRAEAYTANDLYDIFNWDYKLTKTTFNFNEMIPQYGSIIGCLNHIIHVIFESAVSTSYLNSMGITSIDQLWADGGNDKFNENLMATAKFLLKNFTFQFFGRNEAYVDPVTLEATAAFKAKVDSFGNDAAGREGLIAYMLLPFLGDALPQLIYDLDMFTNGLQIEQVAALLVREFLSDLTPQINYDSQIFVDPTFKTGRTFQTKTSAQWMELILNMGIDLGATYLDNICNINLNAANLAKVKEYAVAAGDPAWYGVLEEIVDYGVNYVGEGATSVLAGCEPSTLNSVRCVTGYNYTNDTATIANNYAGNGLQILSTVLNKLLPLGLLRHVSSDAYALDLEVFLNRLIDVIDDLDLEVLLDTFGRNGRNDNILGTTNIVDQLLGKLVNPLINVLLGFNLFPVTSSLNAAVTQANLKTIVANLLKSLYNRRTALLPNALPIVAAFVDDWGSEQAIRTPELTIGNVTYASNGSLNATVTITNGSRGIWRGYMKNGTRVQDEQYAYNIQAVTTAQSVTIGSGYAGKLDYGATKTFTITGSIPAQGLADRIDIQYQVYNEDGQLMENGKSYNKAFFTYYAYTDQTRNYEEKDGYEYQFDKVIVFSDTSNMEAVKDRVLGNFYNGNGNGKNGTLQPQSQPGNGFTLSSWSENDADKETGYDISGPLTFNKSAYTPVGENGAKYPFTYNFKTDKKGLFGNVTGTITTSTMTSYVIIYNAENMALLEELVNEETGLNRRPETYKAEGDYYGYLTALANAISVAWNPQIDNSFDPAQIKPVYDNLVAAIEKLDAAKMTPAEQAAAGLETVDAGVNLLETTIKSIDATLAGKSFRTHMLYRWSRYQEAKDDASRVISITDEYNAGLQTTKFEYSSMPVYQLKAAVKGDKFESYILALLKDLDEDELAEATERFKDITQQYGGLTSLDVAQIQNLATRMSGRLLPREGGVVNDYLSKEIESAKAEIGTTNTKGYSTRSWNAYADALAEAQAAMTSASQDEIFNAKYALQVARNGLRAAAQEADYTELEELIAQADAIFGNPSLYNNTNAEFGAVLAALGYTATNTAGDKTDIFPGSAKAVSAYSYDKDDQEDVDDAANELKKALSKMVFKNTNYGSNTVTNSQVTTGEVDENDNPIMEAVKTTELSAKELISAVKSKFAATTATGATDTEVRISIDTNYSLGNGDEKFVGTGATITIYTTQAGVKIPLSTIKVVVKGDVTGDGVIDVLDCMIVELAGTNHTTVTGVFNLAGDLAENGSVGLDDLGAVANLAKAG